MGGFLKKEGSYQMVQSGTSNDLIIGLVGSGRGARVCSIKRGLCAWAAQERGLVDPELLGSEKYSKKNKKKKVID